MGALFNSETPFMSAPGWPPIDRNPSTKHKRLTSRTCMMPWTPVVPRAYLRHLSILLVLFAANATVEWQTYYRLNKNNVFVSHEWNTFWAVQRVWAGYRHSLPICWHHDWDASLDLDTHFLTRDTTIQVLARIATHSHWTLCRWFRCLSVDVSHLQCLYWMYY